MRRFLFLILVLLGAVWIGLKLKADPGYMLLAYGNWTAEMPLWLGIILLIISVLIIYWLIHLLSAGISLPHRIASFFRRKKLRRAQEETTKGLIALTEGYWGTAEKQLLHAAKKIDKPLINYLACAHAAQAMEAYDRRDHYLRLAHDANPEAQIAVGLTQAQLQLNHDQLEQALATLKHLRDLAPKHKFVLKLLMKVYLILHDWLGLKELLPQLKKQQVLEKDALNQLELSVYKNLLIQQCNSAKSDITIFWQQIPKQLRHDPQLVNIYAKDLIAQGATTQAEIILYDTLKRTWDKELIQLYGNLQNGDGKKQLTHAESFLKSYKNDPYLLASLGKICVHNQLWGKALNYFEASLAIRPDFETYQELGNLLETMGEKDKANECYMKALAFKQNSLTNTH